MTSARRSTRPLLAAAVAATLLAAATPAAAQQIAPQATSVAPSPHHGSPALVKYGKWALLAGSVGLDLLAAREHRRADDAFTELEGRCATDPALCGLAPDGRYVDATSEAVYQRSLSHDHQARLWLVAGQTALLGSAAMFIWELTRPKGPPENIPFEPEVSATPHGTNLGLRVAF